MRCAVRASERRDNLLNGAVWVEFELVDADFAVESGAVHDLAVLPREPVVHDAPFVVRAVHLQDLVVAGAEDAARRILLDHDEWRIVYHRFAWQNGKVMDGPGFHREVCIDKLEFNPDGSIKKVVPTL